MRPESIVSVILMMTLVSKLYGCTSLSYTAPEALKEPCTNAAKLRIAKRSAKCKLLEEVSYSYYEQALTDGDAWIKANNLGDRDIVRIRQGLVWIGMPADAAELAWGKPLQVSKTFAAGQQHEQWMYNTSKYLDIDNGKVSAIQRSDPQQSVPMESGYTTISKNLPCSTCDNNIIKHISSIAAGNVDSLDVDARGKRLTSIVVP